MPVAPGGGLPDEARDALTGLARELRPKVSVVVGAARGDAALALLEGAGPHRLILVERNGLSPGRIRLEGRVELAAEPSHLALPALAEAGVRATIAWLDGRHLFDHLLVDLFYADLLLEPGGVAVVNNAHWPGLRRAVAYFETNRSYRRLDRLPERLAVLRKEGDDDRPGNRRDDAGELFRRF